MQLGEILSFTTNGVAGLSKEKFVHSKFASIKMKLPTAVTAGQLFVRKQRAAGSNLAQPPSLP